MKVSSVALLLVLLGLSWVQITAPVFANTGAQQATRHAALKTSGLTRAHPVKFNFAGVPLTFEKNVGQLDQNIKFQARANGYSLFLTATGALVAFRVPVPAPMMQSHRIPMHPQGTVRWKYGSCLVEMQFVAASANSRVIPGQQLPGKSNYFISRDRTRWLSGVPNYTTVEYRDLYPGVDLMYRSVQSELEYDFIVNPGHNPRSIGLSFQKAASVEIDPHGDLIVRASGGELKLHKPFAYQEYANGKHTVAAHYMLTDKGLASFELGTYDHSRPLVIDPSLSYSTYLGGSGVEHSGGLAIDTSGNVYITGQTASTDFVTSGAPQPANGGGQDVFVTKLNATGDAVVYSTFLGGSGDDAATGIAVDGTGNAYITGNTNSANFPVSNALQSNLKGNQNIFVTKLNAAGSALLYSTYVGGTGADSSAAIAVDSSGNAYVAGVASSSDFPLLNALQTKRNGASDGVVFKLNSAGSALVYSTLLGGSATDSANAIAVDATGDAFVAGSTTSSDFRVTPGAFQRKCGCTFHPRFDYYYSGSITEGWVAKISPTGSSLLYSTYLGGQSSDSISGIATDTEGNAVVTGSTSSSDFPVANAAYPRAPGSTNAFVTKLNPTGSGLLFSTFLGGKDLDSGSAVAVDTTGNAYVAGTTSSTDFPVKNTFQATLGGASDGFITKMDQAGGVVYSSYLGGVGNDTIGAALAIDGSENVYIAGDTDSTNFPTHSPLQANLGGLSGDVDAFVTKIGPADATGADLSVNTAAAPILGSRGGTVTYTHTVANHGPDNATGVMLTIAIPSGMVLASSTTSQGTCSGSPLICDLGTINNGSTATVAAMVTTPNGGVFKEVASATATQPDSSSGNNMAVTNTEVDADFALEAIPSSVTVTAGNPANYSINLSAKDGPFSGNITLSCSKLPPSSSCNFSPNAISLGSDPTATSTIKLLVLTTGPFTARSRGFHFPVYALWMPIALGLGGVPRRRSWKRGIVAMLFSCLLLLLMLQPACSAGQSQQTTIAGTPSGTYHITLTAASGTTSHTTQVTVVVK